MNLLKRESNDPMRTLAASSLPIGRRKFSTTAPSLISIRKAWISYLRWVLKEDVLVRRNSRSVSVRTTVEIIIP